MTDTAKLVQEIRDRISVNRWVTIQQVVASPPVQALIEKANRAERLEEAVRQYIGEYDTPAPDLTLRNVYRMNLRALLAKEQSE